jgi:tetratricopeptide (TPR) repeat protein
MNWDEIVRLHSQHYLSILGQAEDLYNHGGEAVTHGLTLFDHEWANIRLGQKRAEQEAGKDKWSDWICSRYPAYGASLLRIRQHPRDQIQWLETALTAARATDDALACGVHLGHLGVAYFLLGEYQHAIEFNEQNLAVSREIKDQRGESAAFGESWTCLQLPR